MKYEVCVDILGQPTDRMVFKNYDAAMEACYSIFFSLWDSPIDIEKELDCENFEIKVVKITDDYIPLETYLFYTGQNFKKQKNDKIQVSDNPGKQRDKGGDG